MNIIFDFDSTISSVEALDILAEVKIEQGADPKILKEVEDITNLGMNGEIGFTESLKRRLDILKTTKSDIEVLVNLLITKISYDFAKVYQTLVEQGHKVFVISGGFKDFIDKALEPTGVPSEDIFANHFIFDKVGNYQDFNHDNPLSASGGKVELVNSLELIGRTIVIGDGYTDLEIKLQGACDIFIAFTEHVRRERVLEAADFEVKNMKEVLEIIRTLE